MQSFSNLNLVVYIVTIGLQSVKINSSIRQTKRVNISESQIPPKPIDFKLKLRQSSQWSESNKCQYNHKRCTVSYGRSEHRLARNQNNAHARLIPEPEIACTIANVHCGFPEIKICHNRFQQRHLSYLNTAAC
jgi:hypothetical protein